MGVLLALTGALFYGLSDFIGGLASRRTTVWPVALLACVGATAGTVVATLAAPGAPTLASFGWGLLGGVGSGTGTSFLYRGFAAGRMGLVAPVSAVGAALLPLGVGLAAGERPSALAWFGLACAVPGIWLVSREDGPVSRAALVDGAAAGLGFGLIFVCTARIPASAGYPPLLVTQLVSVVGVIVVARLLGGDPRPRHGEQWWGLLGGLLASVAMVCFLLATRYTLSSLAAVLTSLYPASTVLLAIIVLREQVHRSQGIGLLLCAACVALVSAG